MWAAAGGSCLGGFGFRGCTWQRVILQTLRTYFEDGYLRRIPSCFLLHKLDVEFSLWVTVVSVRYECVCVSMSVYATMLLIMRPTDCLVTRLSRDAFYCTVCISATSQVLISHIEVLPSRCSVLHYMHNSEASLPPQLAPHKECSRCSTVSSAPTRTTRRARCYISCSYLGVTQVTHSFS